MITWVASHPRSGNTYLRALLHHHYGLASYSIYEPSGGEEGRRLAELVGAPRVRRCATDMAVSPGHYFVKTHELPSDEFRALYVVRDGRDALVSYAHFILRSR